MALGGSQTFDKTIENTELLGGSTSRELALGENLELAQGHAYESTGLPLPMSARVNQNPDLCGRTDHDNLLPVTSNEEIAPTRQSSPMQRR